MVRAILFLIPNQPHDLIGNFWEGQYFFLGYLPYRDFLLPIFQQNYAGQNIFPPLYYYLEFLNVAISGNNFGVYTYLIKIIWNLYDFGAAWLIYLIAKEYMSEPVARMCAVFYALCPLNFFLMGVMGYSEITFQFLGLLGIYFLIRKKYFYSALFIGLGIAYCLMPIFYLLFIIPHLLNKRKYSTLIGYLGILVAVYAICSIPFLILIPQDFLKYQIIILQQNGTNFLWTGLESFMAQPLIQIPFLNISISIALIYGVIFMVGLLLYFFLHKSASNKILDSMLLISILLPLLVISDHIRLFYWGLPYFIFWIFKKYENEIHTDQFENWTKTYIVFLIVTNIVIVIYYFIDWKANFLQPSQWANYTMIVIVYFFIIAMLAWIFFLRWKLYNKVLLMVAGLITILCLPYLMLVAMAYGLLPDGVKIFMTIDTFFAIGCLLYLRHRSNEIASEEEETVKSI